MSEVLNVLRKVHNIERLAVEIYRAQIRAFPEKEIAGRLRAAMDNEQEHANDLQARITDLGGTTSWQGIFFQIAGKVLGFITTLMGKMFILKIDIRVENKAVKDYSDFLQRIDFDEKSRLLLEKNLEDEKVHIQRWEDSIEILKSEK